MIIEGLLLSCAEDHWLCNSALEYEIYLDSYKQNQIAKLKSSRVPTIILSKHKRS